MLTTLQEKNPNLTVFGIDSPLLKDYGRKVTGIDFGEVIRDANHMPIPDDVQYQAANETLEKNPALSKTVSHAVFGAMPVQIGICWGKSTRLNGLEWHKGSEVIVSATDSVLLIARYSDFTESNGRLAIDTKQVVALYLRAGEAVELYPMVLHLAPCQVSDEGFRDIIILPRDTNEPLDEPSPDDLLLMKNKWMVGHADMKFKHTAVFGENIEVKY